MTSNLIDISQVTSDSLRNKKYLELFPEYYELATVTENNLWHNNQNVLDHVIEVYAGLEKLLEFNDLNSDQKFKLKNYLSLIVGNQTRQNVLKVSALLHDIAITDTIVKNSDGSIRCPGHDLIASARVKNFAERFDLDKTAEIYVERIVRYHGFISEILNLIIANKNEDKYFQIFKETVGDVSIELILLMHADLIGSDLKVNDKNGYNERIKLLKRMLFKSVESLKY